MTQPNMIAPTIDYLHLMIELLQGTEHMSPHDAADTSAARLQQICEQRLRRPPEEVLKTLHVVLCEATPFLLAALHEKLQIQQKSRN
jgi:hypothetical protein